jgi:hypothetical protein
VVIAAVLASDSDISVVRCSACHIVVGPERLMRRGFAATAWSDAGSWDNKHDTIVTSSGGFNVLVAMMHSSFRTGSGLKW